MNVSAVADHVITDSATSSHHLETNICDLHHPSGWLRRLQYQQTGTSDLLERVPQLCGQIAAVRVFSSEAKVEG
jgi:hypothetical protein